MNHAYTVKEKLTLLFLAVGVLCFGFIFADSLSTHVRMVHFAAHFGMSFLLALCFYLIGTVKMKISKPFTYAILVSATLFIGVVYKFWEIASQGMLGNYSVHFILDQTGVMTSMSQNLSGLLGAMLLIEGLLDRNLIMSALRSGTLHLTQIASRTQITHSAGMPAGSQFSPNTTEN
jgi:hypothetical protein